MNYSETKMLGAIVIKKKVSKMASDRAASQSNARVENYFVLPASQKPGLKLHAN